MPTVETISPAYQLRTIVGQPDGTMDPTAMTPPPPPPSHKEWWKKQACFMLFVILTISLTVLTVTLFVMTIINVNLVYAGIGCLGATLFLVGVYSVVARYGRLKRHRRPDDSDAGNSSTFPEGLSPEMRVGEYRRLEREIQALNDELADLQATALCNARDLEAARDLVRREYATVTEWIEGSKVPDDLEIAQLSRALRHLANRVQTIRLRSERISTSLAVRRLPAHVDVQPMCQSPPPPYDHFSRTPQGTVIAPRSHHHHHHHHHYHQQYEQQHSHAVQHRSFASEAGSTRPPPSVEGAPPAYEEAVGTSV